LRPTPDIAIIIIMATGSISANEKMTKKRLFFFIYISDYLIRFYTVLLLQSIHPGIALHAWAGSLI
jgi:hypothetical protein